MKKFLFSFLTPLLVSLFFFIPQVKADTIDLSINTSVLDYDNEAYHTLKDYTLDYISNHSDANYYIIFYPSVDSQVNGKYTNIIDTTKINSIVINTLSSISLLYYVESSNICNRIGFSFNPFRGTAGFQIDTSTLSINSIANILNFNQYYCSDNILNYFIIDTNIPLNLSFNNTYNVFNLDNRGTLSVGSPIPTLVDMFPPTPSDNTPILTDFYTLIIDKFSVITDFFTDNTYLFAIPLIPILVLCIYLIKRSLIK